ncbi:MAG: peroxiredoxin [Methylotenera sp.]|nr:MAG: peroxiredoxin [Methylotenera sp.]
MNLSHLPSDLPAPIDDGAANHLAGLFLPDIQLSATNGEFIQLNKLLGRYVIYIYPMTGQPNVALPKGWDSIPGARGCTPQSCSFRDHAIELAILNTKIFGLSSQTTEYQLETKNRLHLPFELLSDASLELKKSLKLPTFYVNSLELYKRLTMIVENNRIIKTFYPVFPPDKNVDDVIEWLKNQR